MTTIRRINVSQIDGDTANNTDINEIRPFGETAFYLDTNGPTDKLTLMMFDGVRTHLKSKVLQPGVLFGSNADSGDVLGADTIKLIPDAELYNQGSQQYLVVDPTTPNHIHLRGGGPIDNSGAHLFIGGENSNLNIPPGSNPPVYIRSNGNVWIFGTDGSLTFNDGSVQTTAWTGSVTLPTSLTAGSITSTTSPAVGFNITGVPFPEGQGAGFTWTWTSSGPEVQQLIAQGNNLIGATVTQSEYPETATVIGLPNLGGSLGIEFDAAITFSPTNTLTFVSPGYTPATPNNLSITAGSSTFTFGTNGSLTFPNSSVQTTAYTGSYTATTPADWAGTPPTTIAEAIDRLAARIKIIDGGTGA